jgi:hypothetical protein
MNSVLHSHTKFKIVPSKSGNINGGINISNYNSTKPYKADQNDEYVDGKKIVYKSNS